MYEYIKGRYIGINKDYIIVENNGIGYKILLQEQQWQKCQRLMKKLCYI